MECIGPNYPTKLEGDDDVLVSGHATSVVLAYVNMCMCVYVYVCIYVCVHVCMSVCMYVC